jgi:hypothetical protein
VTEFNGNLKTLGDFRTIDNMYTGRTEQIDVRSLFGIIHAIYVIRDNLFHGRKDPEDQAGRDFGLIKAAFPILPAFMTQYMLEKEYFTTVRHRFYIEELLNGYDVVSLP